MLISVNTLINEIILNVNRINKSTLFVTGNKAPTCYQYFICTYNVPVTGFS